MAKPIQILKLTGDGLMLDTENLFTILDKIGEKSISTLSIIGNRKTGKSFLLNFILKYLKYKVHYKIESWLESDPVIDGFDYSGSDNSQTTGIWMWSEPFAITAKDGSELALLLLDTRALSLEKNSGVMFAISLLLSSVMIINFQKDLSDEYWKFYEYYAHFAQSFNSDSKSELFQRLVFMVRDWDNESAYRFGYHNDVTPYRNNYLKNVIKPNTDWKSIGNIETRKKFLSYFDDIGCYLMPHPGRLVTQPMFCGRIELVNKVFKLNVENFVSIVIDKIEPKQFGVFKLSGTSLKHYVSKWQQTLRNSNADAIYERLCDLYQKSMRSYIDCNPSDEDLCEKHTNVQQQCLNSLSSEIDANDDMLGKLCKRTNKMFELFRLKNWEKLEMNKCIAFSTGPIESVSQKPVNLINLELSCPGSIKSRCDPQPHQWFCSKYGEPLEYGFDEYIYCLCGRARVFSFRFKCNSKNHSKCFHKFTEKELKQLLCNTEVNILILGETGVGKSTWINGFVNYITYPSLVEAKQYPLLGLIASSFTMTDNNYQMREITCGEDPNEVFITGQSATQGPKAYTFICENKLIRLIDTPGIGDTRGVKYDKENFDSILRYLSNLDKLHGVCILLKPNNSRIGAMFRFCIKELLTHLHRDASRNIVFCFTNARSTFYRPGDTMPALMKLLQENKEVTIELSKDTVYCLDNESFRFLCALHHGIVFDEKECNNYSESWDKSVIETKRMLEYISGLTPHLICDTLSLNDTRKMIVNLSKPMADITQNILTNINVVEDKKREIQNSKESEKEIKKKLYMDVIQLEAKQLGYPRTVCTAKKCVKYHNIEGTSQYTTEFVTHCHKHCYLRGVAPESYPNPDLKGCAAMAGTNNCTVCECGWDLHMHITYKQNQVKVKAIDETVENLLNNKKTVRQGIQLQIKKMEEFVHELNYEKDTITKVSAKFGSFLKENSIVPYNDALGEYLDVLIRMEKDKVSAGGDRKTLDGLEQTRKEYNEEVFLLDKYMTSDGKAEPLTNEDMMDLVKKLYSLKHNGKELKHIMEVVTASKSQMQKFQEINYKSQYRHYKRSHIFH